MQAGAAGASRPARAGGSVQLNDEKESERAREEEPDDYADGTAAAGVGSRGLSLSAGRMSSRRKFKVGLDMSNQVRAPARVLQTDGAHFTFNRFVAQAYLEHKQTTRAAVDFVAENRRAVDVLTRSLRLPDDCTSLLPGW